MSSWLTREAWRSDRKRKEASQLKSKTGRRARPRENENTDLLDHDGAVILHPVHESMSDFLPHRDLGLGRDEKRVDERLGMSSTDAVEELLNSVSDEGVRDVDAGNDLRIKAREQHQPSARRRGEKEREPVASHLRDDLEPNVDADARCSLGDGHVDRFVVSVLEPEREESEGVLESVPL